MAVIPIFLTDSMRPSPNYFGHFVATGDKRKCTQDTAPYWSVYYRPKAALQKAKQNFKKNI